MMTIMSIITSNEVITYRLSEARALPIEDIVLNPCTFGGESGNPYHPTEQTVTYTVKARDLRKLTPLGRFTNPGLEDVPSQGFDINDGKFYQAAGLGNNNDGQDESVAYLTIKNIHGEVIEPTTRIEAIRNMKALNLFGVTDTGYMEAEGVKVRQGTLYLGYASKGSENKRYATILKYQPCKKVTPW